MLYILYCIFIIHIFRIYMKYIYLKHTYILKVPQTSNYRELVLKPIDISEAD